jgi:hypothetical protein
MIAYIAKLIGDTRIRRKILDSAVSEEMAEALLDRRWPEPRTRSALKWGLVLLSIGVGVLLIDLFAIGFESPIAYGILLLAAGMALLGFYAIERDDRPETPASTSTRDPSEASDPIEEPKL